MGKTYKKNDRHFQKKGKDFVKPKKQEPAKDNKWRPLSDDSLSDFSPYNEPK